MEWVASTLHTTSEHGVSSITTIKDVVRFIVTALEVTIVFSRVSRYVMPYSSI